MGRAYGGHRICSVTGCGMPYKANGYCSRHDLQIRANGYISGNAHISRKNKSEMILSGGMCMIVLRNKFADISGYAIIDIEDANRCSSIKWSMTKDCYVTGKFQGKNVQLGRFILGVVDRDIEVDHRDRNHLDNRRMNLRECTSSQNSMNVGIKKNNTSGFKGVCFDATKKKWKASLLADGCVILNKRFNNLIDAVKAYNEAAKIYHGEFAYLNEVPQ